MFKGYNLKHSDFSPSQQSYYENIGKQQFKKYANKIEEKLDDLILKNGNIDAGQMQTNWFPEVNADIFLSHSHKNEATAIALAGYLFENFKLETFVDSAIWGYSSDLLSKLDHKYCKMDNGYFNYTKRNFTTSNVHMMLSASLSKMMDKAECLFFLNTPNSISIENETKKLSTLSPWIYAEIELSKIIRHRPLSDYRKYRIKTRTFAKGGKAMLESFQYPVTLGHLDSLNEIDIQAWRDQYNPNEDEYALDILYYLKERSLLFEK